MSTDTLRHSLYIMGVSLLLVIGARFFVDIVQLLSVLFQTVSGWFGMIFSNGHWGVMVQQVLSLTLVPLCLALIPAGLYWLIKKQPLPYFIPIVWGLWLMLATALYA